MPSLRQTANGSGCTVTATRASAHESTIGHERNMSQIHAEVPDRVVAADTLVAGDSEEDEEEEEDDTEQDEEEDTEDDAYSE